MRTPSKASGALLLNDRGAEARASVPLQEHEILPTAHAQQDFAQQRQVFVLTNRELKNYIVRVLDRWFGLTSMQIAVAVLVGVDVAPAANTMIWAAMAVHPVEEQVVLPGLQVAP